MKSTVLLASAVIGALSLAGCHSMNDMASTSSSAVGSGAKYTAHTVGSGVNMATKTGATVIDTSLGVVTKPLGYQQKQNQQMQQKQY